VASWGVFFCCLSRIAGHSNDQLNGHQ
jgi:hypothetical protein